MLCESYKYGDHHEHILTAKPINNNTKISQHHILFIPPLFAEMNKMRHTLVQTMRLMANSGVVVILPDLPGCNESIADIRKQSLTDWQNAMRACADQHAATHIVSFRGAALIDDLPRPIWRLNCINGTNILKTMLRSKVISMKEAGENTALDQLTNEAERSGIELAGYNISAKMFNELQDTSPIKSDQIFEGKLGESIEGSPIWMRSEPEYDEAMALSLSKTLLEWCQS